MKSLAFTLAIALLAGVTPLKADSFYPADTRATPGDTLKLVMMLDNSVEVRGLQFDLRTYPLSALQFLGVSSVARAAGWTIAVQMDSMAINVIAYSEAGATISPGAGAIMEFKFILSRLFQRDTLYFGSLQHLISDANLNQINNIVFNTGSVVVDRPAATALFTMSLQSGESPLEVEFDASACTMPADSSLSYEWDFGDGLHLSGSAQVSHVFNSYGMFQVILTIKDPFGNTATTERQLFVYPAGEYARGDVNRDGHTDIFDLLELLRIISGGHPNL